MKLLIVCLFAILAIAAGYPKPELLPAQAVGVDGAHLPPLVRIARASPGPKGDLEGSESSYGYIYPYYYYPYWGHHYGYWGK